MGLRRGGVLGWANFWSIYTESTGLLLNHGLAAHDTIVISRHIPALTPFQFKRQMLARWWILALRPLDPERRSLGRCHESPPYRGSIAQPRVQINADVRRL